MTVPRVAASIAAVRHSSSSQTSTTDIASTVAVCATPAAAITTSSEPLRSIVRYGANDGYVVINVGGDQFYTLKSTLNSNPVLAYHISASSSITTDAGAIFVDRDPKHFPFILQYLRHQLDGQTNIFARCATKLSATPLRKQFAKEATASFMAKTSSTLSALQLPTTDTTALHELYIEATYYGIPALQNQICGSKMLTRISSVVGGGSPFDAATKLMTQLRTWMIAFCAIGGTTVAVTTDEEEWEDVYDKIVGGSSRSSMTVDDDNEPSSEGLQPAF